MRLRALAGRESGSELSSTPCDPRDKEPGKPFADPSFQPCRNGRCLGRLRRLQPGQAAVWPSQSQRHRKRKAPIPPNKPSQGSRNDKNVRCQRQLAGVQTAGAKSEGNCHFLGKAFPRETGARGPWRLLGPTGVSGQPVRGPSSRACSPGETES